MAFLAFTATAWLGELPSTALPDDGTLLLLFLGTLAFQVRWQEGALALMVVPATAGVRSGLQGASAGPVLRMALAWALGVVVSYMSEYYSRHVGTCLAVAIRCRTSRLHDRA
jgi:hypothetical protein